MPASAALKAWPGGCSSGFVGREIVDEMEAADADGVAAMQLERLVALEAGRSASMAKQAMPR